MKYQLLKLLRYFLICAFVSSLNIACSPFGKSGTDEITASNTGAGNGNGQDNEAPDDEDGGPGKGKGNGKNGNSGKKGKNGVDDPNESLASESCQAADSSCVYTCINGETYYVSVTTAELIGASETGGCQ